MNRLVIPLSSCLALAFLAALVARAQTPPTTQPVGPSRTVSLAASQPAAAATSMPARQPLPGGWLRVTADDVNLRARADLNSVIVMRMPRDTVLRAESGEYGWYRVAAPPGVFSYVAKLYVRREPDGTGVVSLQSGTLRVRLGSLMRELDPDKSDVQTRLENGAKVRIIAEEGEWLKIVPPDGVWYYVSTEFVAPVTDEVAERLRAATEHAAALPATDDAPLVVAPVSDRELDTEMGRKLLAAEGLIDAESRKPVLQQSWRGSLDALAPLAAQETEPRIAVLAAEWVAKIEAQIRKQDRVRAAKALLDTNGESGAKLASDPQPTSAPARRVP